MECSQLTPKLGDIKFIINDKELRMKPEAYLVDMNGGLCFLIFTGYSKNVTMPHEEDRSSPK